MFIIVVSISIVSVELTEEILKAVLDAIDTGENKADELHAKKVEQGEVTKHSGKSASTIIMMFEYSSKFPKINKSLSLEGTCLRISHVP